MAAVDCPATARTWPLGVPRHTMHRIESMWFKWCLTFGWLTIIWIGAAYTFDLLGQTMAIAIVGLVAGAVFMTLGVRYPRFQQPLFRDG